MPCAWGHEDSYQVTSIYSLYDSSDRLLYIGKTSNLTRRYKEHSTTQPWKSEIAYVRVQTVYCSRCASELELRRIREECPAYNVVGSQQNRKGNRKVNPIETWSREFRRLNPF